MTAVKCVIEECRVERLRPRAGAWFSDLLRAAEVTESELAEQVGADLDEIAAFEEGTIAVPAALYEDFATVFGMPVQDFAKTCLMYENPSAYEALFGSLPEELRAAA